MVSEASSPRDQSQPHCLGMSLPTPRFEYIIKRGRHSVYTCRTESISRLLNLREAICGQGPDSGMIKTTTGGRCTEL